jgi:uncharacterized protein YjbJ (UPF0337 family)
MPTKTELKGHWHMIRGRLKQQFANLTDDDLQYEEGREEELYGRLQRRIGKSKEEIKRFIDDLIP